MYSRSLVYQQRYRSRYHVVFIFLSDFEEREEKRTEAKTIGGQKSSPGKTGSLEEIEQIKGLWKKLWDKGLNGQRPRNSRDQLKGSLKKTKPLLKSSRKAQETTTSRWKLLRRRRKCRRATRCGRKETHVLPDWRKTRCGTTPPCWKT